jgi:hypothetical protein
MKTPVAISMILKSGMSVFKDGMNVVARKRADKFQNACLFGDLRI